ncbi:hypothetical protein C5167_014347 [Papaver somniferum]|uniref:Uncharacterized protein n=1 Tax=Papaver somniferum TaxID=3469 RepID=A0A4Y7J609_PAPSO|nr:hypothetical protein C5167_014347 [Papaver somniferum]
MTDQVPGKLHGFGLLLSAGGATSKEYVASKEKTWKNVEVLQSSYGDDGEATACLSQVPTGSSLFSDLITPTVAKIHTAKQEFSYEENVNTEEEDVDAVDCDRGSPIILATRPTEFYNLQSLQ